MTNPASDRQRQAADPRHSTWVSANAGSGKTKVLTDRVARLLLGGTEPQRILCLTYTKAAAAEMQNRLFRRLGGWAMLPEPQLRAELAALDGDGPVTPDRLAEARRLFARAIETPGGLRIQTIHSFCAGLLRRFPLEAGVSPRFTEMDDRSAALLRADLLDDLAAGPQGATVARLAAEWTGEDLPRLAAQIAGQRAAFAHPLTDAEARAAMGLPPDFDTGRLLSGVFLGAEADLIAAILPALAAGSANDVKAAEKLATADMAAADMAALTVLEDVLLTKANDDPAKHFAAKLGAFPTKATRAAIADHLPVLEDLMRRVETARPQRLALAAARRMAALHGFAAAFLPRYEQAKAARGWLDFDDLIQRAAGLLSDPSVAQWVLFRLDGGIDHILVDEAQDTSPAQWGVIERLADEFTAGQGTRDTPRTIFVVGDRKQSIYSFQGADLTAFRATHARFHERLHAAGSPLQTTELEYSFRSAPAILRLVDLTFDPARGRDLDGASQHIAFRDTMPGRVDLWPPIDKAGDPDSGEWFAPVDLTSDEHHAARIGRRVAETIRDMIDTGRMIPESGTMRPVEPRDFLVLVRRRADIFAAVIRSCKQLGLPIAGADRLRLGAELAVKDILALLSFLATPEDDLSLAAALRSPLFGWTEAQLYALAQPRQGYLWQALRTGDHAETLALIDDLRRQTDFLRPYDLIDRILTRHDGRRRLIARLGPEAEDGIDELLTQALAYEQQAVPSLTGFLGWLAADEVEVKRQAEGAGGRIRVMTVHGAKGLESPVVILPDTAARSSQDRGDIVVLPGGTAAMGAAKDARPEPLRTAAAARRAAENAESLRLLYVALTRAQSWLIVGAAGPLGKDSDDSDDDDGPAPVWYSLVRDAMVAAGAVPTDDGGLLLEQGDWPAPQGPAVIDHPPSEPLPDW
ncbi:MAG TPA: double-strand break repair helicase AddA, partial [Paracoccaceae bacterium]|nr:double-strand break repair helicase AddA [Paracoccaceae bacterium]